jgi:ferric-dicitrate binding protein FerR (iron transport regulator)
MKPTNDLHLLAVRYLDDAMPAAERAAYVERLRSDAEARSALNDAVHQSVTLAEMMLARPARRSDLDSVETPKNRIWHWFRPVSWAAVVLLLVVGFTAWMWPRAGVIPRDGLVTVTGFYGSVSWIGTAGETHVIGSLNAVLPAGTFVLDDGMEQLEFVFRDGTRVSLRGPAELVVAEDGKKRLHLRSGSLSADVVKQPEGRAMIVRTPIAEGVVLGTSFELAVATDRTSLAVNHGLVQLRRLADNQTVQVAEQRVAVVSRDTSNILSGSTIFGLPKQWSSDFSAPPEEIWRGDWLEPEGAIPGRMQAVGKMSKSYGAVHYRAEVRALHGPLVALSRETTVRLRYRLREEAVVELFVNAATTGGRFAGNFRLYLRPGEVPSTVDGWYEATLPVSSFDRIDSGKKTPQPEALRFFYISSLEQDAGLEIASLEIMTP